MMISARPIFSNHAAAVGWGVVIAVAALLASFAGSLLVTGAKGHPLLLGAVATIIAAMALWRFGEAVFSRPCVQAWVHDGALLVSAWTLRRKHSFFFELSRPAPRLFIAEESEETGRYYRLQIERADGAVIPLMDGYARERL